MTKSKKSSLWPALLIINLLVFLVYPVFSPVQAEDSTEPEKQHMPGTVEGEGTYFEITDSEYLNVSLTSNESVKVYLESIPRGVSYFIESETAISTQITLTGFDPEVTYYLYQDGILQGSFNPDTEGGYSYVQDLTVFHHVFILEKNSTIYINADGSISPATAPISRNGDIYTLTGPINDSLYVLKSGITLDGAGNTINGQKNHYCLYSSGSNFTYKNLILRNCTYGMFLGHNQSNNTITNNNIADMFSGIIFYQNPWDGGGGGSVFYENAFFSCGYGFRLYYATGNYIHHNAFINSGLQMIDSSNTWDNSAGEGNYWTSYTGTDLDSDGVGDTNLPHLGVDWYPLMAPSFNIKPLAKAGGPYNAKPGVAVVLDASASYDPIDPLEFRWDFDNDGVWDTPFSSSPTATNTWYSNYSGWVKVEVSDGVNTGYDIAHLRVENIGNTLVADRGHDRVVEVDQDGNVVWQKTGFRNVMDAERLENGNTLIADIHNRRVVEINPAGTIVWQRGGFFAPIDVDRLENGNTLMADYRNYQIYEIDPAGVIVWQIWARSPLDADRLANGNTLITDNYSGKIYEIDSAGNTVWERTGFSYPYEADRLKNGNTLISGPFYIYEVDSAGTIVWSYGNVGKVRDVDPLPNGNIIYVDEGNGRAVELDREGNVIWEAGGFSIPAGVQRIPPPFNTMPGTNVTVSPHPDVTVTFTEVTEPGDTTATVSTQNPGPDKEGFKFLNTYYDIETTAVYTPPVTVCLNYDDTGMSPGKENALKIFHWDGADWINVTSSLDTVNNVICGTVDSLSWFAAAYDEEPPVTTIDLAGTMGNNNWYVSDVQVSLSATDNVDGSGVAYTEYSFDSINWFTYIDPVLISNEAVTTLYYRSLDNAENVEWLKDVTFQIDKTPPLIMGERTPEANMNGWNNTDITVLFNCTDPISGIAICPADTIVSTEGTNQSVLGTAYDNAGNSASDEVIDINIDKTMPDITLTKPGNGAIYILNQEVLADWTASDALSGLESVSGTTASGELIDTSTVGDKTYTVTATDYAGNVYTKEVTYHVHYLNSGIRQPINPDITSIFKLNRTIPVKFRIWEATGAYVPEATAYLHVTKLSDEVVGVDEEFEYYETEDTGFVFRYDPEDEQYIYNLRTKDLTIGTYLLTVAPGDGSEFYAVISLR